MDKVKKYSDFIAKWIEENGPITIVNFGDFLEDPGAKTYNLEDYCALDVALSYVNPGVSFV